MRTLLAAIGIAIAATGCVSSPSSPTRQPLPPVDLTDPIVAASLGSPEFTDIAWERRAGRWTIVGDGPLPQPVDVEIIQAASSDIPAAISTEPRQLIRTASAGVPASHPASAAVAVAKGPDVYLLDGAFTGTRAATRWSVGRVLVHELVHVAQWYGLAPDYVAAARSGDIAALDLDDGSALVTDWAKATGWNDSNDDPLAATWTLTGQAPNAYAATSPSEDMSESVSLAAAGLGDSLDANRVAWIEAWTGATLGELGRGRPWVPAHATEVSSADALYDEASVSELAIQTGTHVDPIYFELAADSPSLEALATSVADHLQANGLAGQIQPDGQGYAGAYQVPDGSVIWVELIEGRELGAEGPLLIYVWLW
ncbi:MAG: hypothetical protein JJE47_01870 [Acidimicrobiia bacterium]|nr:hypothetical protein [Acidimicrobiia bacterium]